MKLLESLLDEFRAFPPGTRARALTYLRWGVLEVTANALIQAKLDRWVSRLERAGGPCLHRAVLHALEEAAAR